MEIIINVLWYWFRDLFKKFGFNFLSIWYKIDTYLGKHFRLSGLLRWLWTSERTPAYIYSGSARNDSKKWKYFIPLDQFHILGQVTACIFLTNDFLRPFINTEKWQCVKKLTRKQCCLKVSKFKISGPFATVAFRSLFQP